MKAILEFNLPEDQEEYDLFRQVYGMHNVIWEMKEWLRSQTKYAADETSEETVVAMYKCADKFNELINEFNLEI